MKCQEMVENLIFSKTQRHLLYKLNITKTSSYVAHLNWNQRLLGIFWLFCLKNYENDQLIVKIVADYFWKRWYFSIFKPNCDFPLA